MHKSSTSPTSEVVDNHHVKSLEEVSVQKGQELMQSKHRGTDCTLSYLAEGTDLMSNSTKEDERK